MKMICDKAGQFKGCIGCSGAVTHDKNYDCVDDVYVCRRVEDEQKDVLVMCVEVKENIDE